LDALGDHSLIYSDSDLVDDTGNFIGKKMSDIKRQIAYSSPLMYTFGAWAPGHSMLFRKDLLHFALPIVDYVAHDYLIGFAATCAGGITYLPKSLVHYRQHATNTIGANLKNATKPYKTKKERNHLINLRLQLIYERCPEGENKLVLKEFAQACAGYSIKDRIQRVIILMKHHRAMLAYKGKSELGSFLYSFKLLFSIF
jgi:hypothetical protein